MKAYQKVYLIGNGRTADNCLKILHEHRNDVVYLAVEEEKFQFSEKFCERNGIEYLNIGRKGIKDFLLTIKEHTLIISAHNGYLFPAEVVKKSNLKIINMHIALLPLYRGRNAPTWEIFENQQYAGTTWHEVTAGIDDGGIIVQEKFEIEPDDTALQVLCKSFELGVKLFDENVDAFLNNSYNVRYPDGKTKLYQKKDRPNGGFLDLAWPAERVYAFLRSMDYSGTDIMPLPQVIMNGDIFDIWKYKKIDVTTAPITGGEGLNAENSVLEFKFMPGEERLICWLRKAKPCVDI